MKLHEQPKTIPCQAIDAPDETEIWIGDRYRETGILVLGESWYGSYPDRLATDAGYIDAYLARQVEDRMYSKLAGMTGTAETEAGELWDIYKLDVVVIPTNTLSTWQNWRNSAASSKASCCTRAKPTPATANGPPTSKRFTTTS